MPIIRLCQTIFGLRLFVFDVDKLSRFAECARKNPKWQIGSKLGVCLLFVFDSVGAYHEFSKFNQLFCGVLDYMISATHTHTQNMHRIYVKRLYERAGKSWVR